MMVVWGVCSRGVAGPNTAMELGQYTCGTWYCTARFSTFSRPSILSFQANIGSFSAVAESRAARWYICTGRYCRTNSSKRFLLSTSSNSKGPPASASGFWGARTSAAITASGA